MVEMGKEYGFPSNFDLPWPFNPHKKGVTAQKSQQPIRLPNGLLYPRVEVEQQTHSGDEIGLSQYYVIGNTCRELIGFHVGVVDLDHMRGRENQQSLAKDLIYKKSTRLQFDILN